MAALEALEDRTLLSLATLDIYPGTYDGLNNYPIERFGQLGNYAYFAAGTNGSYDLYRTDGTPAGTTRVRPMGSSGSQAPPDRFQAVGNTLYFSAEDNSNSGVELWKTDGTQAGTSMVTDLYPGSGSSSPIPLGAVGGKLAFAASSPAGYGIYTTDGTEAGTALVKGFSFNPRIYQATALGGELYFAASDGTSGTELWKTDGTQAGTVLVKDINPGSGSSNVSQIVAMGSELYFTAAADGSDKELWKSDGTDSGTSLVKDIRPGSSSSGISDLVNAAGTLYFFADDGSGSALWKSDGTAVATVKVHDVSLGSQMMAVGTRVFFRAWDATNGTELWTSDGTGAGTGLVKDVYPGSTNSSNPQLMAAFNGRLVFRATTDAGSELWLSDGTSAGTLMLKDINPGVGDGVDGYAKPFDLNGALLFAADDGVHGREVWTSDGTTAGTSLLKDLGTMAKSGAFSNPVTVGSEAFFSGDDGTTGVELWKTDGTLAGTSLVKDIYPGDHYGTPFSSQPSNLTDVNGTLFFSATDPTYGSALWKSDGTSAGTVPLIGGFSGSYALKSFTNVNGELYFVANNAGEGWELWRSDGTSAGTALVKDIQAGSASSNPHALTVVGGTLYFLADDGTGTPNTELWKTDGTSAGTVKVHTFGAAIDESDPWANYLAAMNGRLYLSANDGTGGQELWSTDGTDAGTTLVADINPGTGSSNPAYLTAVNSTLYFQANDGSSGLELWKSDGTAAGTVLVKDIDAGAAGSSPSNLTNVDGTLYFQGNLGGELWKSDGTASGTSLVWSKASATYSGGPDQGPIHLTPFQGSLYFVASTIADGRELWQTDLSSGGTQIVQDFEPGSVSGLGSGTIPAVLGNNLLFLAESPLVGTEVRVIFVPPNEPPTPSISNVPTSPPEGTDILLNASATDPNPGDTSFTYSWSVTKNDQPYTSNLNRGASTAHFVLYPDDNGTYVVTLQATDPEGASGTTSVTLDVQNVAPKVTIGGYLPDIAFVGDHIYPNIQATDSLADSTSLTYAWSASLNGNLVASGTDPYVNFTPQTPGDYVLDLSATDKDGASTTISRTITVATLVHASFDQASSSVDEGAGTETIGISLDAPSGHDVTIPVSLLTDGTATQTTDFSLPTTSVTIPAGQTHASATLSIVDDNLDEADETVVLALGQPDFARLGSPTQHVSTIVDNDPTPRVSITPDRYGQTGAWVQEGDQIYVSARLSSPSSFPITVPFSLGGTATQGTDYTLSGAPQFVFQPGQVYAGQYLSIIDDTLPEGAETIVLKLQTPTTPAHATISTDPLETSTEQITIAPSDEPTVHFSQLFKVIDENGSDLTATFTASLDYAVSQDVTIPLTIDTASTSSPATRGADFKILDSAGNEIPTNQTAQIVIPAGQTQSFVTFEVLNDALAEPTEWIPVRVNSAQGAAVSPQSPLTIEIPRNDLPTPVVTITTDPASPQLSPHEADASTVSLTVSLSQTASQALDIPIVVAGGTATEGADYFLNEQYIHIPAGQTSVTQQVLTVVNDRLSEGTETVVLQLGSTSDTILGSSTDTTRVVKILDDDPVASIPPAPDGSTPWVTVSEGVGTFWIDVNLSFASTDETLVPFWFFGNLPGPDYSVVLGSGDGYRTYHDDRAGIDVLAIDAGRTSGKIPIQVVQDNLIETDETSGIFLGPQRPGFDPTHLAQFSTNRAETFTIVDDDHPTVSFSTSSSQMSEGDIQLVGVQLSAPATKDVTVKLKVQTSASSAHLGSDFTLSTDTITIPAGQQQEFFKLSAVDDKVYEPTEMVKLSLSSPVNATLGSQVTYQETILDNDPKPAPPPPKPVSPPPGSGSGSGSGGGTSAPQSSPPPNQVYSSGALAIGGTSGASSVPYNPPSYSQTTSNSGSVTPAGSLAINLGMDGPLTYSAIFFDANKNGLFDFLDLNGDGTQQAGEPSEVWSTTGLDGVGGLTIPTAFDRNNNGTIDPSEGQFVLVGGTDSSTNLPLGFALTAPMGSTVLSPLTTLMANLVNDHADSPTVASARLVNAFGLADVSLGTFDPIAGVLSGDPTQAAVFSTGVRVQDLVTQVSHLIAGAPDGPSESAAAVLTFAELASRLSGPGSTFDLGQPVLINALIDSVAGQAGVSLDPSIVQGAAQVIAETDARIVSVLYTGDLAYLQALAQVQMVAQGRAAKDLSGAASGSTSIANVVSTNTGTSLSTAIQNSSPGNVVPPAVWIDDPSVQEGAAGADTILTFTVHLNVPSTSPVSLDWSTLDGTATTSGGDYTAGSGTLSWAAGDNSDRTIQVHVQGDSISEGDEFLQVLLSNISGAVAWQDFGTGTIIDDDGLSYTAPAASGPNNLRLQIQGDQLQLTRNDEIVRSMTLSSPGPITITGADGVSNSLTIDVVGDNSALLGGLHFSGGSAGDSLSILHDPSHLVVFTPSGNGSGTITLDGASITYNGVESANAGLAVPISGLPSQPTAGSKIALPAPAPVAGVTYVWSVTRDGQTYSSTTDASGALAFTPDIAGTYTVTLSATDANGATGQTVQAISVASASTPAPQVSSVVVNGGAAQRSNIETISIRFNENTNLASLIVDGSITQAVQVLDSGGTPLNLDASRYHYDATTFTLTLDLTVDGFGGSRATMLTDGQYQIQLSTTRITAAGASSSTLQGSHQFSFFRLEGDFDGSGTVDTTDQSLFLAHYGTYVNQSGDNAAFDLNGDGVINILDYFLLRRQAGKTV